MEPRVFHESLLRTIKSTEGATLDDFVAMLLGLEAGLRCDGEAAYEYKEILAPYSLAFLAAGYAFGVGCASVLDPSVELSWEAMPKEVHDQVQLGSDLGINLGTNGRADVDVLVAEVRQLTMDTANKAWPHLAH